VTYISEAVASVGSPPTRIISSWVADQIAPKYWRPNHDIKVHNASLFISDCHDFMFTHVPTFLRYDLRLNFGARIQEIVIGEETVLKFLRYMAKFIVKILEMKKYNTNGITILILFVIIMSG
jgi:hypothetical protein